MVHVLGMIWVALSFSPVPVLLEIRIKYVNQPINYVQLMVKHALGWRNVQTIDLRRLAKQV